MKSAVITFPGSNCDRDMAVALETISGHPPYRLWHQDTELPDVDLIAIPGGFSYGDYLRCGAISAQSAIMPAVKKAADKGITILGVCNGFQILTEMRLLPGVLMRNKNLTFVCEDTQLIIANKNTPFTRAYKTDDYKDRQSITIPVAHHDGNYIADDKTLDQLEDTGRVLFRYDRDINGSMRMIAGVTNAAGNVLGMMPHPERAIDAVHGGTDGLGLFRSLIEASTVGRQSSPSEGNNS